MKHLRLFEAFIDAIKWIESKRRGECNLYEIWTKLGGRFKWGDREIDLQHYTQPGAKGKLLIPVAISTEYDEFRCLLYSITIKDGEIVGKIMIESQTGKETLELPLSEINLDRSQEMIFSPDSML